MNKSKNEAILQEDNRKNNWNNRGMNYKEENKLNKLNCIIRKKFQTENPKSCTKLCMFVVWYTWRYPAK